MLLVSLCLCVCAGVCAVAAGKEEGDLGEFRSKLLSFLDMSSSYEPARLISDFPFDGTAQTLLTVERLCQAVELNLSFDPLSLQGLLEERALLLGRMGKHEQALFIYVHVLKDTRMAEE